MTGSNRQKKIGALAQKESEGTLFTHTHHGGISEEVAGTLTSTGLMKQQIMIRESDNSNMSRAESMVFEEQPDGGLCGILTINGLTANEWYVNGEDTECVPNLRAKGEAKVRSGRIRKLTARECFRLMNVDEVNIDKIQAAGISETQQYKMAGNSIVVNVLAEIFRKLFVDEAPEEGQQLLLF